MDNLVYDRTQSDVDRLKTLYAKGWDGMTVEEQEEWKTGMKGAWKHTDANRVEEWSAYLVQRLAEYGYIIPQDTHNTWALNNFVSRAEMDRIRTNVDNFRDNFFEMGNWREITYTSTLDFEQANTLEWDLNCVNIATEAIEGSWFYSGEFLAGEGI